MNSQKGFTIIEVLIVLAIAALIMLIVFLAVPNMQRNSRNNQRNNDATRIAAAVTECLAAHNALNAACDTDAEIEQGTTTQLTTITFGNNASYQQTSARVWYGSVCNADGTAANNSGNTKFFTLTYQIEPAIDRCVGTG